MMKKLMIAIIVGVFAMVLAGCGTSAKTDAPKTAALQELTIGIMPDVDSIPFIIAQEKGFFKDENLNVNIKSFKSAMDRDSALQSGNLDGAVSDMLAAAFSKNGGFDIKITSITNGSYKLIAGKDESAVSVGDLRDRDVAISKNTIIEYVTDKILAESQMSGQDIKKVVIPQIPTRLEMLQNGNLAAATLPEPLASLALSNGCKLINSSDKLGINPGIILFTNKAVTGKEQEIAALYRAYDRAVDYLTTENPQAYIDLVIEKGGFPKTVKKSLVLPIYNKAQAPSRLEFAGCMEWLREKELIKQEQSYEQLVDSRFIGQK